MTSISTRFAVAIHMLAAIAVYADEHVTSDFLAESIGTNPVVVRRISRMLATAGILRVHLGIGGAELVRSPERIRLIDVYRAVSAVETSGLFARHDHPDVSCRVGSRIERSLESLFGQAQTAMERVLERRTMRDIVRDMSRRVARPARVGRR